MSLATHCIPWDEECDRCNPPPFVNPAAPTFTESDVLEVARRAIRKHETFEATSPEHLQELISADAAEVVRDFIKERD